MATARAEILYEVWRRAIWLTPANHKKTAPPHWHELQEEVKAAWDAVAYTAGHVPPKHIRSGGYCVSCGAHESEMHLERCPYSPQPQHLQGEFSTVHICTCGGSSSIGHAKSCATRTPIRYEDL
jgi:hypothetical protein